MAGQKVPYQRVNFVGPLPKRRHIEVDDTQPV
jgi:hypothetical protein